MPEALLLDAGPLGRIAHPRMSEGIAHWLLQVRTRGDRLVIPEIADYEVRRDLLLTGLSASVLRLDLLRGALEFLPLDSDTMLTAADLWAKARRAGRPTAAPSELDGDVILAAQAIRIGAAVVTENPGHLSQFVNCVDWRVPTP